jgi:type I restriction enzyme S subunit
MDDEIENSIITFSEAVDINPQVPLKKGSTYSFVEMKDLDNAFKYAIPSTKRELSGGARFREKDTLFARITPCLENGKICQAKGLENEAGFGSTEFLVFRGKEGVTDTDFVYYLSRSRTVRDHAEANLQGTSGRQRVSAESFDSLFITLPPLSEQKRIAAILSAFDEKIELNRKTNQILEEIAQTIFKEWFIDFNYPGATGEMVDSPLGPIPKGWEAGRLIDIALIGSGKFLKRNGIKDTGYPVIGANGKIGFSETYNLENEAIVTGRVGTLGTLQLINQKIWVTDNVLVIEPKIDFFFHYIYFWMRSIEFSNLNRGSTQPLITKTDLMNQPAIEPPVSILKIFNEISRPLFNKIIKN